MTRQFEIGADNPPHLQVAPTSSNSSLPRVADLYCDLVETPPLGWRDHVPGLVLVILAVLAASFVGARYGAPITLFALLFGLTLNFLGDDKRLAPGLNIASSQCLRIGIVLVAARITVGDVVSLGPKTLFCVIGVTAGAVIAGVLAARMLGLSRSFGILAGGAVAICGASAAMSIFTVLGESRTKRADLAVVLIGISLMSAFAMFLYPIVARDLHMDSQHAGFFLGASIHDVAQALGAGYAFSNSAGETATIVKLARVTLLAPLLAIVSLATARATGRRAPIQGVPAFVVGFFVVVMINSARLIPVEAGRIMADLGATLVVVSITAAGMKSPLPQVMNSGVKPVVVIALATAVSAALALGCALWII